jgi:hypothetical protein
MKENIRLGLFVGLALATVYSAWALGLFLLSGEEPFAKNQTSLFAVLLTYYTAGAVGGALLGSLLPLSRSFLGRFVLGIVGPFVFFLCVVARQGPFWNWGNLNGGRGDLDALLWNRLFCCLAESH